MSELNITILAGQKKRLLTAGKYCENNIVVTAASNSLPDTGDEGWIGDGNTHIWISLQESRTSPMLGVCPNGTVTVDWGDGATPDVLTGTSTSTVKWTPIHEYAEAGDYIITLTVDGEASLLGDSNTSYILRYNTGSDGRSRTYANALRKIEIGNGVTIAHRAFYNCRSLSAITIPEGVTSIADSAFYNCYSLSAITIPEAVTSIGNSAFYSCHSLRYCDFTKHTSVVALGATDAFGSTPLDLEIRVPAALYDEWIAATNWATYASYIKAV